MPSHTHSYPPFVSSKIAIPPDDPKKRYSLELTIDSNRSGTMFVLLKNPSKAIQLESDHTVNRVLNYIYKKQIKGNPRLINIGKVVILNLIPFYEPKAFKLKKILHLLYDDKNLEILRKNLNSRHSVIVAWGNPPKGIEFGVVYNKIKTECIKFLALQNRQLYFVASFSKYGNPKHGQVWADKDPLRGPLSLNELEIKTIK